MCQTTTVSLSALFHAEVSAVYAELSNYFDSTTRNFEDEFATSAPTTSEVLIYYLPDLNLEDQPDL